jgi:hypothetical protein
MESGVEQGAPLVGLPRGTKSSAAREEDLTRKPQLGGSVFSPPFLMFGRYGGHIEIPLPGPSDGDGHGSGNIRADLIVDSKLIVELKSVKSLKDEHIVQTQMYMKYLDIPEGMLINFPTCGGHLEVINL